MNQCENETDNANAENIRTIIISSRFTVRCSSTHQTFTRSLSFVVAEYGKQKTKCTFMSLRNECKLYVNETICVITTLKKYHYLCAEHDFFESVSWKFPVSFSWRR